MSLKRPLWLGSLWILAVGIAQANGISFTCNVNIDATVAGTCNTLNTNIAGIYNNAFSNANASIFIEYGTTGLGQSTSGFLNLVSYNTYRNALAATASANATDTAAVASLPTLEPGLYANGRINLTSALGQALGIAGMIGTTSNGSSCVTPGVGGCYNGIITISNPADLLANYGQAFYYRSGTFAANAYDFYTVVQHEADEILGTPSCISTVGGVLTPVCGASNNIAAVDLFRYSAPGSRVLIDQTPGAYFSFDGGNTSVGVYNTLPNGNDYADWITSCQHVQDGGGCVGQSFDITSNGGAEVKVLDAIGYNLKAAAVTPEPSTFVLLGMALAGCAAFRRSSRS